MEKSSKFTSLILVGMLLFLLLPRPATAEAVVHIVAASSEREHVRTLLGLLPSEFGVKLINPSRLAMGDYSEKQKLVARMERGKITVVIGDKAMDSLAGVELKIPLIVVRTLKKKVKSSVWLVRVLSGSGEGKIVLNSGKDLKNLGRPGEMGVVWVAEDGKLSVELTVRTIIDGFLKK